MTKAKAHAGGWELHTVGFVVVLVSATFCITLEERAEKFSAFSCYVHNHPPHRQLKVHIEDSNCVSFPNL